MYVNGAVERFSVYKWVHKIKAFITWSFKFQQKTFLQDTDYSSDNIHDSLLCCWVISIGQILRRFSLHGMQCLRANRADRSSRILHWTVNRLASQEHHVCLQMNKLTRFAQGFSLQDLSWSLSWTWIHQKKVLDVVQKWHLIAEWQGQT